MAKASRTFTTALTLCFSSAFAAAIAAPSASALPASGDASAVSTIVADATILPDDYVFSGDWDRDGKDSLGVVRDGTVLLADDDSKELGDYASYSIAGEGRPVVGHWGTKTDTVALDAEGISVKLRRWFTDGNPDRVFQYGNRGDVLFSGSWNGSTYHGPGVRRGSTFYIKTDSTTGVADRTFDFGKPGGEVLVGDWDGDGVDGVAVRHGDTVELRNDLSTGEADDTIKLPSKDAAILAGDFDGDGTDAVEIISEKPLGKPTPHSPASEEESLIPLAKRLADADNDGSKDADVSDEDSGDTNSDVNDANENDASENSSGDDKSAGGESENKQGENADTKGEESDDAKDKADNETAGSDMDGENPDESSTDSGDAGKSDEASGEPADVEGFSMVVGRNAEEGLYRIKPQSNSCDLSVLYSDGSKDAGRVETGENSQVYITLEKGDALEAPKCDIELIDLDDINPTTDVPTDGEWLVGADVPAGDFHVEGDENCFASILSDTSRHANIIVSVEGTSADVTIKDGQLVSTDGCTWSKR